MCVKGNKIEVSKKPVVVWKWMKKNKSGKYVSIWDTKVTDKVLSTLCRSRIREVTYGGVVGGFCAFYSKEDAYKYKTECNRILFWGFPKFRKVFSGSQLRKFFIPIGVCYFHGQIQGGAYGAFCKAICADTLVRRIK